MSVIIDPFLLCVVCCVLCGWCVRVMCVYLYVRGLYLWYGPPQLFFVVCVVDYVFGDGRYVACLLGLS